MSQKPLLIMLCGLPGSGKSTYANFINSVSIDSSYIIHSSDELRKEMFGDVNENSKGSNEKLFLELHKRIKTDLRLGNDVIYDATNINRNRRISFLKELKNIPCTKNLILCAVPYYMCLQYNKSREKKVPDEAIRRMYLNFQPPHISEGWDKIEIDMFHDKSIYSDYKIPILFNHATGIDYFNQGNEHHKLTLGEHCKKTANYVSDHCPGNILLWYAALLHDEGKMFTMSPKNSKGEYDGNCHYYQHNCTGAYDAIFYMLNLGYDLDSVLHVSNLIYFHMHPYREWKASEKCKNRMKKQLGDRLFDEINILHEADAFAH